MRGIGKPGKDKPQARTVRRLAATARRRADSFGSSRTAWMCADVALPEQYS